MFPRRLRSIVLWSLLAALLGLQLHGLLHDHAREAGNGEACQVCAQLAQQTAIVVPAPVLPPVPQFAVAAPSAKPAVRSNASFSLPQLRGPPAPLVTFS